MKIYTRKGDEGTTSLVGGARVGKDDLRVEAYGTVDELMAHIAYLNDLYGGEQKGDLLRVQRILMSVSAVLATDSACSKAVPAVGDAEIDFLEQAIDGMSSLLPQIDKFTLPGGHPAVSMAHICRTVCRRAERAAIHAGREHNVDKQAIVYLNRLSDYLYMLGRHFSVKYSAEELLWVLDE